jgi:aspartyl-tRNA(Asn)/glutamyl-tRNA(Gln) amidotransferase subunit B
MTIYDKYETVIGLEVHVQLATKSKAFCGDSAVFGASPNTQVSAISLAHPGTLPRMNEQQLEYAVRLGLALGCRINPKSHFDRKNYFYADLPKGFQTTQDREPICIGGEVTFDVNGVSKTVRLHHIHIEEDAGKSIHDMHPKSTYIDLNRAGVPLVEMVSEPDMRSSDEVAAFMNTLRQLVRYLEVSDGNMEEGSLRCDCNVSVRLKGAEAYGNRCEIKNMNSMRYAKRAIDYEVKRQINLIESGGRVEQQTLNFDPVTGITAPLRDKEDAHDYRYFPEPDLLPILLSEKYVEDIRAQLPPLPSVLYKQFTAEFGLNTQDAYILTEDKQTALFYLDLVKATANHKAAANLVINKIRPFLSENGLELSDFKVSMAQLASFMELIESGKVSNTVAYQRLFPALVASPDVAPATLAEQLNLLQSNDSDFIVQLAEQVLAAFPDKVTEYKKGKKGLIAMFMGELMKRSKGKAEPKAATAVLEELLKR